MKIGFRTDIGRRRSCNEDALLVLPKYRLYAVADGVGGRNFGEIASRKAVGSIEQFIKANPIDTSDNLEGKYRHNWFRGYFLRCFQKVNADIMAVARQEDAMAGMATTAVVAYIDGNVLYITNIGDSRAYIIRSGVISQLTKDHTYVNRLIEAGTLTKSEARDHPQKNMITRALGVDNFIEPDFYYYDIEEGDRIFLCTDGLHGELTDSEINACIATGEDANSICKRLVRTANEKGGGDNITVVYLEV